MTLRAAKIALVFAIALYYTLVVFNNLNDYNTNYQFARHVLMMDTTFPGNHGMWRAVNNSGWHTAFYIGIIGWESVVMLLCWIGGWRMLRDRSGSGTTFEQSKMLAVAALTLALLMWLVAFVSVGGEWFFMWQSSTWNGEEAAARMFTIIGVVFLILVQPEREIHS
jgi:predicted small integral membrane protein